jgi:hypothetical protein
VKGLLEETGRVVVFLAWYFTFIEAAGPLRPVVELSLLYIKEGV